MKNKWTYQDPSGAWCQADECTLVPGGDKVLVRFEAYMDSWQDGKALANRLVDAYKGINRSESVIRSQTSVVTPEGNVNWSEWTDSIGRKRVSRG